MSQQEFYETVQRQQEWEEQMSKHTPGPWKTNGDPYVSTHNGRQSIAFTDVRGISGVESRANARLIAAAPDLLDALNVMLGSIHPYREDGTPTIPEATIDIVNAAIEKATGDAK